MWCERASPLVGLVPWPVSLPAALMARLEGLAVARGVGRSRVLRDCLSAGLAAWRMEEW